jgi:hypothetical protein
MSTKSEFSYYRDVFGGWRWESLDRTGEAIDSRDCFESKAECVEDAQRYSAETARGSTVVASHNAVRVAQRETHSSTEDTLVLEAHE